MTKRSEQHRFHLRLEDRVFQEIRQLAFDQKESIQSLLEGIVNLGLDIAKREAKNETL